MTVPSKKAADWSLTVLFDDVDERQSFSSA